MPSLPYRTLSSLRIRPGILLRKPSASDDDETKRLLDIKKSVHPAFDVHTAEQGSNPQMRRVARFGQFVSVTHNNPDYDKYLAEVIFCGSVNAPDGTPLEFAFVRWMDDPPAEDIGTVHIKPDEPQSGQTWAEVAAALKRPRRAQGGLGRRRPRKRRKGSD